MTWIALAYALQHADAQQTPASGWWASGRIVDERAVHLGIRPACELDPEGALNWGVGVTVQLTVNVL
jgi:hypothetical protein